MRTCRTCGWPLIGTYDRCPWCGALVLKRDTMPLELAQDAEFVAMVADDDQAFEDWHGDNMDRRDGLRLR